MGETKDYPKKYWWVVIVALPIVLGLIAVVPGVMSKAGGAVPPSVSQTGVGNIQQTGAGSVINDYSSKMYVTNVSIIEAEYAKYQGQPLSDQVKRQIEQAVADGVAGRHAESIRLLEELARKVPVPALYNNLGVEYAKSGQTDSAQKAFQEAIAKDPQHKEAKNNLALLPAKRAAAPSAGGRSIVVEASTVPTVVVEPLAGDPDALKEIHLADPGTKLEGSDQIRYAPQPGSPTIVNAGTYDVVVKTAGGGGFVLARNVEIKDGTRVRINPNALLGNILVEPLTLKGFPEIKELTVFEAGSTGYRAIFQRTDRLGTPLPIVPGSYDVFGKTAEGGDFVLAKNVAVKARETNTIKTNAEVAAILVHDPKIAGSKVEAVYVLVSGATTIAAQSDHFEKPMIVVPGESYDVALKQPGGVATIKRKITPKRGELITVP